ncbi:MAG: hypothetical protein PUE98_01935 [Galactobacillus timonensis]|uniref:hypothetical protein n=1 Tax=Galactobacillus timonensis TaxID=2041840 RepID=UPI002409E5D7|nr:hypothetical protein [Galactobacillus timonensis]MDD6599210.1 hypothetical protein [Galactobacillus timonensis]
MLGLRKQEDEPFMRFMTIVQKYASKKHCVFFLDAALGDDIAMGNVEGDNCTGWLIPNDKVELFNELFKSDNIDDSKWVLAAGRKGHFESGEKGQNQSERKGQSSSYPLNR